jgi:tripartite-type tricarboxylate transporter receptor subunit TctC
MRIKTAARRTVACNRSLHVERNLAVVSGRYRETIMQRLAAQRLAARARAIAAATLLIAAAAQSAAAQTVEQFYKGRQLTMLVFTGPGSTYDIYARVLARHFGDHVPGKPVVIVQNMLGAGGLKVEQYIYRIAPKDGTVVGTIGRGLPFEPMLGENEVNVDPLKFTWLGSMNRDVSLAMSWHTSKVKTFADLQQHELLVPGTGAGADSEILPLAFNRLAGTQFKIIEGYRDTPIAALAMERGELDGLAYWSWSSIMAAHPDWIRDQKVNLLFHTGLNPIPEVPQVPSLRNLVTNPTDKAALAFLLAREIIGRPFLAPPDLPPDRAAALRSAFAATLRDPAFLQDAKRTRLDVSLVTGADVDALLRDSAGAPKDVLARVKQALGRK